MGSQRGKRLSTTLVPARITGLKDLQLQTTGRILEVSSRRLHIGASEPVAVGARLQVAFEDSCVSGEVLTCEDQGSWYAIAVYVDHVVKGSSDLAHLLANLIDPAER
jgi:hypothetical protein